MMQTKTPLMLSAKNIIDLGFSRAIAYQLLNRNDLPVIRIGSRKFLHRDLFFEWLNTQASNSRTRQHN